jgi:hypothetical protein
MRMEPDLQRSGGIYLELQRMKKKSNFPLRMDGKTFKKNSHIFRGASESENISALFFWEDFLNIPCSLIC